MSKYTYNCTLVTEDSVVVQALPDVSSSAVEISAVASVGDGVWLSLEDTKKLHAALGIIIRDVESAEKKYAMDLEPGDVFMTDGIIAQLVATDDRTETHVACMNLDTHSLVQVRWSQQVRVYK